MTSNSKDTPLENDIKQPFIIRTSLNRQSTQSSNPIVSLTPVNSHNSSSIAANVNSFMSNNFVMSSPSKIILPSPTTTSDNIKPVEISTPTFRQINIDSLNSMTSSSPLVKVPASSYELFPKYSLAPSRFSFESSPSIISSIAFVRNISSSGTVRSLGSCLSLTVADNAVDSDEDINEIAIFKRHLNAEQREKRNYETGILINNLSLLAQLLKID